MATIKRSGSSQIYKRKDDLEVPVGMPDCPGWLDDVGKKIWDETARLLYNQGVITLLDRGALSLYCNSFSIFLQARKRLKKDYTITTKTGAIKPNPILEVSNKAWEQVLKISKEMGLTPAARAGLGVVSSKREAKKSTGRFFGNTG